MNALRGRSQLEKARRETRAMHKQFKLGELQREREGRPSPKRVSGCENRGEDAWFQVAGDWEDQEEGENCGECNWCDKHDD